MVSTRRLAAAAVCCLGVGGAWGGRAGGAARPSAFAAPAGGVDCWRRPLPARPFLSGHNSPAIGCGTPGTRPRLCVRAGAPRAGGLKAAGRPEGGGDDDIFGQDFPSYNNVNDVPASDGAPKFAERGSKAQGPGSVFEAGAFGGAARRAPPSLREEDLTEGLKERVYYVMLDAFDNYPPQEVSRMLDLLWAAGPDAGPTKTSLRQLVQLTSEVEGIAEASRARSAVPGSQFEDLLDALQVARSRVRMNAKDADMYDPQTTMGFLKGLSDDAEAGAGFWDAWGFGGAGGSEEQSSEEQSSEAKSSKGATREGAWWWPF